jgi:hypothetical protein
MQSQLPAERDGTLEGVALLCWFFYINLTSSMSLPNFLVMLFKIFSYEGNCFQIWLKTKSCCARLAWSFRYCTRTCIFADLTRAILFLEVNMGFVDFIYYIWQHK